MFHYRPARHRGVRAALAGGAVMLAFAGVSVSGAQAQSSSAGVGVSSGATCVNPRPGHENLSGMVIGFSQSENEQNPFRAAETESVRSTAKSVGVRRLLYTNANSNQAKQVADIENMISQGAKAIIVAPLNATGLQPALEQAAQAHVPVVTIDRATAGTPCRDFITFMGSDFRKQGERAAQAMVDATNGTANIVEIQGAYGNVVEAQRSEGFAAGLKGHPGLKLLASQSGNWSATDAQRVMEQLLLAHPDINALYTHADVMTLGAIRAITQSGRRPGHDIRIVSIDGTRAIVQMIASDQVQAAIETNPRLGPAAFDALKSWFNGTPVPQTIITNDALYTRANAATSIASGAAY